MDEKQFVNKDNLVTAALAADDMRFIIQGLTENYFDRYDPTKKEDSFPIVYEFRRYRAYMDVVSRLCQSILKAFDENGITAYDK